MDDIERENNFYFKKYIKQTTSPTDNLQTHSILIKFTYVIGYKIIYVSLRNV